MHWFLRLVFPELKSGEKHVDGHMVIAYHTIFASQNLNIEVNEQNENNVLHDAYSLHAKSVMIGYGAAVFLISRYRLVVNFTTPKLSNTLFLPDRTRVKAKVSICQGFHRRNVIMH